MLTRIAFVAAVVLALLSLALSDRASIGVMALTAACFSAVLAALEAGRSGRYVWVAGLVLLAVVLNPIRPVAPPPTSSLLLLTVGLAVVASWIFVLSRTVPSQSIAQVLHPQDPK